MDIVDIKIKDQFNNIREGKAFIKRLFAQQPHLQLCQKVEHIVVDDEILMPSTELLFASPHTSHIYKIIED